MVYLWWLGINPLEIAMRRIGYAFFALMVLGLVYAPLLCGCRTKTDCRELGGAVGATWKDGPKVGVDASLGQHEVEIQPLFPQAGDAAEGGAGSVEVPDAPRKRFSDPD